jgi:hypothetical protein
MRNKLGKKTEIIRTVPPTMFRGRATYIGGGGGAAKKRKEKEKKKRGGEFLFEGFQLRKIIFCMKKHSFRILVTKEKQKTLKIFRFLFFSP